MAVFIFEEIPELCIFYSRCCAEINRWFYCVYAGSVNGNGTYSGCSQCDFSKRLYRYLGVQLCTA